MMKAKSNQRTANRGDRLARATTELGQTIALTQHVFRLFKIYWATFQERRKRERARADLYNLSDKELKDIGITRGEIDYITSNRSIDPPR